MFFTSALQVVYKTTGGRIWNKVGCCQGNPLLPQLPVTLGAMCTPDRSHVYLFAKQVPQFVSSSNTKGIIQAGF